MFEETLGSRCIDKGHDNSTGTNGNEGTLEGTNNRIFCHPQPPALTSVNASDLKKEMKVSRPECTIDSSLSRDTPQQPQ